MFLDEKASQDLVNKVLALSKADSCWVSVGGWESRHIRYAQNMATTSGAPGGISVSVTSNFGKRSATASTVSIDDASLANVVDTAERLARIAPENPELMPPLGKQTYGKSIAYVDSTRTATSEALAAKISPILTEADAKKVLVSGYIEIDADSSGFGTSAGLFAFDESTSAEHSVTARTPVGAIPGNGSGWAGSTHEDLAKLDVAAEGSRAISKALMSQGPIEVEPAKFTVILEPSAVADLLANLLWNLDQRSADEGRSFASKPGKKGVSRIGEKMFGFNVSLYSDPADPLAPGRVYSDDGLPSVRTEWIKDGVLQNLSCSRYWAEKTKRNPVPSPSCLVMKGGTTSTDDMIKQTKRGLLITRLWYIRMVDPQTVVVTGLTRDGVFLIDHGAIYKPTQNFRFNYSPLELLNNIRAMGPSVRTHGSETGGWAISAPTVLADGFNLTSISDAV